MTVIVTFKGRTVTLHSADLPTDIVHRFTRKNRFRKEEVRQLKEEIVGWCCGTPIDTLDFQPNVTYTLSHKIMAHTIINAACKDHNNPRIIFTERGGV